MTALTMILGHSWKTPERSKSAPQAAPTSANFTQGLTAAPRGLGMVTCQEGLRLVPCGISCKNSGTIVLAAFQGSLTIMMQAFISHVPWVTYVVNRSLLVNVKPC
jgi:hypothetical protein